MSHLRYPDNRLYRLPKKNALVVSCMDLRLTDNLVDFLHHDNLTNRYDHFVLAGCSLTCCQDKMEDFKPEVLDAFSDFTHWRTSLHDHIQLAVKLHHIRDVYIVEHEDCGAYTNFLKEGVFATHEEETWCHSKYAVALADKINLREYDYGDGKYKLHVHCFLIDLRGNVELLYTTNPHGEEPDAKMQS